MEQAIEDAGGEDLVACEDLGPVSDMLVRGQDDRALLIAGADEPEEQVGLGAVERPEPDLVDDEQGAVEVALRLEAPGRDGRIALEHVHEVVEYVVLDAEAVLDGFDTKRDGEMALADPGRSEEQHVLGRADIGAGRERIDLAAVDAGLEREVEALERLTGR